jgi:hypothetical protein
LQKENKLILQGMKEVNLIVTEEQWNAVYDDIYKLIKEACEVEKTDEELKQIMNAMKSIFTEPSPNQQNLN